MSKFRITMFILSSGILLYSLFMIVDKAKSSYSDNKKYESLREQVIPTHNYKTPPSVVPVTHQRPIVSQEAENKLTKLPYEVVSGSPSDLDANGILKEYSNLHEQNNELIGWLQMPGYKKPIDYPLMQAQDNDYYLTKDFDNKTTSAGSLFLDYANEAQEDKNLVIYGHAMKNKTMFGNLSDYYANPEEYSKLTKIYLNLMNVKLEFEVFSTYAEKMDYNYRQMKFASDKEYLEFLERIRSRSVYDYQVAFTPEDRIITLSTCNYRMGSEDYRSVIHAKLVKKVIY